MTTTFRVCELIVFIFLVLVLIYKSRKAVPHINGIHVVDSTWMDQTSFAIETTPRVIVQSWKSRETVPKGVFDDVKQFAPGYAHVFFDDEACRVFMSKFYPSLYDMYDRLETKAHGADLFRYCYLYKNGGIWLDIKVVLVRPIEEVFSNPEDIYTTLSMGEDLGGVTCHQGILSSPPRSAFLRDIITSFVLMEPYVANIGYLCFCRQMYLYLQKKYPNLSVGRTTSPGLPAVNLFQEFNIKGDCPTSRDRYGFCNYMKDSRNRIVFKVRDPDFPYSGAPPSVSREELRVLPKVI